ncbi:MAG TPA: Flp pilus assembly protein CpaB [Methyloradius sp.]
MALRLGKLRINRLWILVVSAVVLGLFATWLSITYLKNREKDIETQLATKVKGGPKISVVVPTDDLPAGTILREGTVAARDIATDLVYKNTITADDFDAISGKPLLRAVQKGRPLMREDIIDDRPKDFSQIVPKGLRAITVDIDELNSISQMLKPGDFIDLHLIAPEPGSSSTQQVFLFLQHVKVLATGTVTTGNQVDPSAMTEEERQQAQHYSTITIEVTPEEAAYVALAQQSGRIRATLREGDDNAVVDYPPVTSSRLVGFGKKVTGKADAASAVPAKVEYIVGGKGGNGSAAPININVPGLSIPGTTLPGNTAPAGVPASLAPTINSAINQANPAYTPR